MQNILKNAGRALDAFAQHLWAGGTTFHGVFCYLPVTKPQYISSGFQEAYLWH